MTMSHQLWMSGSQNRSPGPSEFFCPEGGEWDGLARVCVCVWEGLQAMAAPHRPPPPPPLHPLLSGRKTVMCSEV